MLDVNDYEKMIASMKLISHLEEGEKSSREEGWFSLVELEKVLGR